MGKASTSPPDARARSRLPRVIVSVLLIAGPVVLGLAVPLYQRSGPTLVGIPFFYWFQMSMAVVAAIGTGSVYRLLFTGEDDEAGGSS